MSETKHLFVKGRVEAIEGVGREEAFQSEEVLFFKLLMKPFGGVGMVELTSADDPVEADVLCLNLIRIAVQ